MNQQLETVKRQVEAMRIPLSHERLMQAVGIALRARMLSSSGEISFVEEQRIRRDLNVVLGVPVLIVYDSPKSREVTEQLRHCQTLVRK